MRRSSIALLILLTGLAAAVTRPSFATPMGYSDSGAFEAALPSPVRSVDFDTHSAGTLIPSGSDFDGITFDYDFGGVEMMIADGFATTSPPNFLGTDDASVFQDGDSFGLSFAPVEALGLFFITLDDLFDGDITLTVGGISVALDASAVETTLADGSQVFFLGIIDDMAPFTSASIVADGGPGGPFFLYNVDDILISGIEDVAEPGTLALLLFGLLTPLAGAVLFSCATQRVRPTRSMA